MTPPLLHHGRCHCGAVRFEVRAPAQVTVLDCDCSICARVGYLHLIVQRPDFFLSAGRSALTEYRFGSGRARHLFCRICGVKAFYVPRSHPHALSINLRCLDRARFSAVTIKPFHGQEWEAAAAQLAADDPTTSP